ncbi:CC chemokine-like protein [Magpiepox virus]|nr:CC chemokine-like protein [Magpiepox virus]
MESYKSYNLKTLACILLRHHTHVFRPYLHLLIVQIILSRLCIFRYNN